MTNLIYRFRGAGSSLAYTLCEIYGSLYCAPAASLNDPFDGVGLTPKEHGSLTINKQLIPLEHHWTIACFTESWNNPVMWAHYTESFNGVCLVYDLDEIQEKADAGISSFARSLGDTGAKCHFDKVEYHDEMPNSFSSYQESLFAKTSDWKYENEWRLGLQFPGKGENGADAGVSIDSKGLLKQILVGTGIDYAALQCIIKARNSVDTSIEIRRVKHASSKPGYELGALVN